jgi:type I restriction enzyme M protein
MVTRKLRELSKEEISKIAKTYHNYQNDDNYEDILGFCKKATLEEIQLNDYVLTPGRYVGTVELEDDGVSFDEKMKLLTEELSGQFIQSNALDEELKKVLGAIGYDL